jgi:hypothetical protein
MGGEDCSRKSTTPWLRTDSSDADATRMVLLSTRDGVALAMAERRGSGLDIGMGRRLRQ